MINIYNDNKITMIILKKIILINKYFIKQKNACIINILK